MAIFATSAYSKLAQDRERLRCPQPALTVYLEISFVLPCEADPAGRRAEDGQDSRNKSPPTRY